MEPLEEMLVFFASIVNWASTDATHLLQQVLEERLADSAWNFAAFTFFLKDNHRLVERRFRETDEAAIGDIPNFYPELHLLSLKVLAFILNCLPFLAQLPRRFDFIQPSIDLLFLFVCRRNLFVQPFQTF